ncbi:MAG: bifunctional oligoribonuclease/PAP phosphatase NrnA [Planctomycetota bacterium]
MPDALTDPAGLRSAIDELRRGRRFLVICHARPDGDALGSQLALGRLLASQGKEVDLLVDGGAPDDLMFLPGAARIGGKPAEARPPYDAVVVLDSAGIDRIEGMRAAIPAGARVVNIDHHASNPKFGAVNWVEPESGSVGEMIYALAKEAGWALDRDAAVCLYTAVVTDTGRFMFPSTRPSTHTLAADLLRLGVEPGVIHRHIWGSKSLAELKLHGEAIRAVKTAEGGRIAWTKLTLDMFDACGVVPTESQEFVSMVKSIKGVEVAMLLRPSEGGTVKLSVRAEPTCNAAALCARFGGGGHKAAAGATLKMSLDEAEKAVVEAARSLIT